VRLGRMALIMLIGCAPAVGTAEDSRPPRMETPVPAVSPAVPVAELIDQLADSGQLINLYRAARTVRDVEAANESVKSEVMKAQSIASGVARWHATSITSCEDSEASQVDAIAIKARTLSATIVQMDAELTKALVLLRQRVETEKRQSTRTKEDVYRLTLATHEIGRLRVQAQEIAKTVEDLAASIRPATSACAPTLIPPLFTAFSAGAAPGRSSASRPDRVTKR
jgi:hypothetical protein